MTQGSVNTSTSGHPPADNPVACPSCDLVLTLPPLEHGARATCPRCDHPLSQHYDNANEQVLAYAVTSLILLLLALSLPFLNFSAAGASNQVSLPYTAWSYSQQHMPLMGLLVSGTIVGIPLLMLGLTLATYLPLRWQRPTPWLTDAAHWLFLLQGWYMADVFLLGLVVSLVKLHSMADLQLGLAFWAYMGFTLCFTLMQSRVDHLQCWRQIAALRGLTVPRAINTLQHCRHCGFLYLKKASHCPCCHSRSHRTDRRRCLNHTLALLVTASLLYIPANLYPIMITTQFGQETRSTILGGIWLLVELHSYPVAFIIFCASVVVPLAKLLALFYLCWMAKKPRRQDRRQQTQLYRVAEFMGKWSMVDIYVVAILIALVQLQGLMRVEPGVGALAFAGVVIVTMLAAERFDPRLLWRNRTFT